MICDNKKVKNFLKKIDDSSLGGHNCPTQISRVLDFDSKLRVVNFLANIQVGREGEREKEDEESNEIILVHYALKTFQYSNVTIFCIQLVVKSYEYMLQLQVMYLNIFLQKLRINFDSLRIVYYLYIKFSLALVRYVYSFQKMSFKECIQIKTVKHLTRVVDKVPRVNKWKTVWYARSLSIAKILFIQKFAKIRFYIIRIISIIPWELHFDVKLLTGIWYTIKKLHNVIDSNKTIKTQKDCIGRKII